MIEMILALVIDTFIVTGLNKCDLKTNFKNFFGIETVFATLGFIMGQVVLQYINVNWFYHIVATVIIAMQIIDVSGYEFPASLNAMLIGIDSLFVFTIMPWYAIPMLLVFEAVAIIGGTSLGSKVMKYIPEKISKYLVNIVMVFIAIKLVL